MPIPEGFLLLCNILYGKKGFSKHKHIICLVVLQQPCLRAIEGADTRVYLRYVRNEQKYEYCHSGSSCRLLQSGSALGCELGQRTYLLLH